MKSLTNPEIVAIASQYDYWVEFTLTPELLADKERETAEGRYTKGSLHRCEMYEQFDYAGNKEITLIIEKEKMKGYLGIDRWYIETQPKAANDIKDVSPHVTRVTTKSVIPWDQTIYEYVTCLCGADIYECHDYDPKRLSAIGLQQSVVDQFKKYHC